MFVGLSGSITSTSIKDFWPYSPLGLKGRHAAAHEVNYMNAWSMCLDKGRAGGRGDISTLTPIMQHFGSTDPRDALNKIS